MNKFKKLIASVLALSLSVSVMCFSVAAEEGPVVDDEYVAIAGGTWDFEGITSIPANVTTYNTIVSNPQQPGHTLGSRTETVQSGKMQLKAHYTTGAAHVYEEGATFPAPNASADNNVVKVEINTDFAYVNRISGIYVTLSNGETFKLASSNGTGYFAIGDVQSTGYKYDVKYTITFDPEAGKLYMVSKGSKPDGSAFTHRDYDLTQENLFGVNGELLKITNVSVWYTFTNDARFVMNIDDVTFKEARKTSVAMTDLNPGSKLDWYKRYDEGETSATSDYGVIMERTAATAGKVSTPALANRRTAGTTTDTSIAYANAVGIVLDDVDSTYKPILATAPGASYDDGDVAATAETAFKVNTTPRTEGLNEYLDMEIHVPSGAENDVVWFLIDKDAANTTNVSTHIAGSDVIDAGYAKLSSSEGKINVTVDMTGKTQGIYKLLIGSKNAVAGLENVKEIDYLSESAVNTLWETFSHSTEATLAENLNTVTTRPAALDVNLSAEPYASNGAAVRRIYLPMIANCSNFNEARDAFNLACKIYTLNTKATANDLITYLTTEYEDFLCDFSGDYAVYEVDPDDYYTYFRQSYDASTKTTLQQIREAHKFALGMTTINIANKIGLYSAFEGLFDTYYDAYGCDNTSAIYAQYSSLIWRAFAGKDLSTKENIQALYNAWNPEEEEGNDLLGDLISGREQDYDKTASGAQALIIALNNWKKENATTVRDVEFTDLGNVKWAENAILALYKREIVNGTGNNKFSPNATVTREQVVKMIVSAFNVQQNTVAPEFVDVDKDAWYAPYINAAYSADIIKGYDETQFGVGKNMTRADIAVVLYRYMKSKGIAVQGNAKQFNDAGLIPDYAQEAIAALSGAGVINGTDEGNFEPTKSATRAEFAVMLNSMLNLM